MSNCKKWMNQKAVELNDDPEEYFVQMKEDWLEKIEQLAEEYFDRKVLDVDDRPDICSFSELLCEEPEFTFQDYPDWFSAEVSSVCDDYADYLRELEFDRTLDK